MGGFLSQSMGQKTNASIGPDVEILQIPLSFCYFFRDFLHMEVYIEDHLVFQNKVGESSWFSNN